MLPPIDHQAERERFGSVSEGVPTELKKCDHKLKRINANEVQCDLCKNGWRFDKIPDDILSLLTT